MDSFLFRFLLPSVFYLFALVNVAQAEISGYRDSVERVQKNKGIELLLYKKMTEDKVEHFSVRNTNSQSVKNIKGILIYKTMKGEVFHQQDFIIEKTLEPGAAKLTSIPSFDQEGRYSFHMNFDPRGLPPGVIPFMVEIDISGYDIID